MNERIRELAEQAGLAEAADVRGGYIYPAGMEKFAELIAREFANIDFRHKVGMTTDQEFDTSRVILEHFGIKQSVI